MIKLLTGLVFAASILTTAQVFGGSESGGGGDAYEERVDEIRGDILSWIQRGGSQGLILNDHVTLDEYNSKMKELLQPKKVIVTFVLQNHPTDEELQVTVAGKPKTCRGFISRKTNKPHILCHIGRFDSLNSVEQYKLIHHEFAGLGSLEINEGAASDYHISSQITEYLEVVTELRLALKKPSPTRSRNWYEEGLSSILALRNIMPHLKLIKAIYKHNQRLFDKTVEKSLQNDEAFDRLSQTILRSNTPEKKLVIEDPVMDRISHEKTVFWRVGVNSKVNGNKLFDVDVKCTYVESNIDPKTCGEYCYRAAQDIYECSVSAVPNVL